MRRVLSPALIFVGALLLAAAIALPLVFTQNLRKLPMDLDFTTTSTAIKTSDTTVGDLAATMLNPCSTGTDNAEISGANLTQQTRVVVVKPASKTTATLQAGTSTKIDAITLGGEPTQPSDPTGNDGCLTSLLSAQIDTTTVNRTNGRPAGGTQTLQLDEKGKAVAVPDRSGQEYVFPFQTSTSGNYSYYDTTTRSPIPLKYVDKRDINGVTALHFSGTAGEVNMSSLTDADGAALPGTSLTMPKKWFSEDLPGNKDDSMPASLYARNAVDVWVDPVSGIVVDQRTHINQYYKFDLDDDAEPALADFSLTNLNVTFEFTPDTQRAQANLARDISDPIMLYGRWIPIAAGVVGVLALLAGLWLLLRGPRRALATSHRAPRGQQRWQAKDAAVAAPAGDSVATTAPPSHGEFADPGYGFTDLREPTATAPPADETASYDDHHRYAADSYGDDQYRDEPYGADQYEADHYQGEQYEANQYGEHYEYHDSAEQVPPYSPPSQAETQQFPTVDGANPPYGPPREQWEAGDPDSSWQPPHRAKPRRIDPQ